MLEEELDEALSRPRYGRRKASDNDAIARRSWWRRRILPQAKSLRRCIRPASVIGRLLGDQGAAHPMQGHLSQERRDAPLPLAGQHIPNRRRQIAHPGIQANGPKRIPLQPRFSAIRCVPSIYERYREWDIETTFQESRAHLGVETQRQWSDAAIARTTPGPFGLFSLLTLWVADPKITPNLRPRTAAWYHKNELTFSDIIAAVRRRFWLTPNLSMSRQRSDSVEIPIELWNRLTETLCFAA